MKLNKKFALMQIAVIVLYCWGFWTSHLFMSLPGDVTPVWLPAGISFASILLFGYRALFGVAIGVGLGCSYISPSPWDFTLFCVVANSAAPAVATWCLRRYGPKDLLSVRVRNTFALLIGGSILAAVSSSLGVLGLIHINDVTWANWGSAWMIWWVGDFFGAMIFTPFMVCTVISIERYREGNRRVLEAPVPEIYIWAVCLIVMMVSILLLSRITPYGMALSNIPLALFVWSALRFAPIYTYGSVTITFVAIITLAGLGFTGIPLPQNPSETAVLMLFISTISLMPQLVAASNFERMYFESKLVYRANHDKLTGLRNRGAFEEHTSAVLMDAVVSGEEVAMAYLDLDQFKVVNDTCGHTVGNNLIRQISAVLEDTLEPGDIIARMAGDEFAVLFRNCSREDAVKRAEKLRHEVEEFRFVWNKRLFAFTMSIGVVTLTGKLSFTKQLSLADTACYKAKEMGRNRIKVVEPGDTEITKHHHEVEWVVRINEALEQDRFCLFCQPIVPIMNKDDNYKHFEILIRMRDATGNILSPGTFIPAAERFHLMHKVDRWVVEHTLRYMAEHPKATRSISLCSINLSGPSLSDLSFHQFLKRVLKTYDIPPEKICFEVTETAAIGDLTRANRFIKSMRREGCCFALDDFGSGLASFGYLKTLHVDYLKIDGAFVRDIARAPIDHAMVKSINEVGHVMGKKTIAEYVESEEVENVLRSLGVDYAQGHGVGKPIPIEDYFYHIENPVYVPAQAG